MSETATANFTSAPAGGSTFQYSITLTDTSATSIGTFWFAWDDAPGQNFLSAQPTSVASPSGWTGFVTHGGPTDGYGIEWVAQSSGSALAGGGSLSGFSFVSADTPAYLSGSSAIDPAFLATSSFVYHGGAFGDAGYSFAVVPACFAEGTRIRSKRGDLPVEALREGDIVVTQSGVERPVIWVGRQHIECGRHPRPARVWPVRVAAGAFAAGVPLRDLFLSPDHAVFANEVLIPVKHLINGTTIAQVETDEVTYYHVELDAHDVLLSEGLPTESYLETGARRSFETWRGAAPDTCITGYEWEANACAPLIVVGPDVEAVRQRLA